MEKSIEQLKQEVREISEGIYAANLFVVDMIMQAHENAPEGKTIEYWMNVLASLTMSAAMPPKDGKAAAPERPADETEDGFVIKEHGEDRIITDYKGGETSLVIPAEIRGGKVVEIAERAFNRKGLVSVTIPDTVTTIRKWAFANNELTSVTIPGSVTLIGETSFERGKITSVTFLDGTGTGGKPNLTVIGKGAFYRNAISEITWGNTIAEIHRDAFRTNEIAGTVVLPETVTVVADDAFDENKGIETLVVPDAVEFRHPCGKWSKAIIEKLSNYTMVAVAAQGGVKYSNASDFTYSKTNDGKGIILTEYKGESPEIIIPPIIDGLPVTTLSNFKLVSRNKRGSRSKSNPVTTIVMPDSITTITGTGLNERRGWGSLKNVTLGNGLKTIPAILLDGLKGLTHITIPDSVTVIERSAFNNSGLTSVIMGKNVTHIHKWAFFNCSITEIEFPPSLVYIGESAFKNNKLKSVTIPRGVTYIPTSAFENNGLESLTLPNTITHIETYAFATNKIKSLTLPNSLRSIHSRAFYSSGIRTLVVSDSVDYIDDSAFQVSSISSLDLGNGVKWLGQNSFEFNLLRTLIIPESVRMFGAFSFCGNDTLHSVAVPNSIGKGRTNLGNRFECMKGYPGGCYRCKQGSALSTTGFDIKIVENPNGNFMLNTSKPHDAETQALHEKAEAQMQAARNRPLDAVDALRPIDDELNCSIFPKGPAMRVSKPSDKMSREDYKALWTLHRIKDLKAAANQVWIFQAQNNFNIFNITEWKTQADADTFMRSLQAENAKRIREGKSAVRQWANKGNITISNIQDKTNLSYGNIENDIKLFNEGNFLLSKEDIINNFTERRVGEDRILRTVIETTPQGNRVWGNSRPADFLWKVREITPAGNWLWELEFQNEKEIGVVIGWANNADAQKAEQKYKTMPELQYRRRRNVTGYVRGGEGMGSILHTFTWAADEQNVEDE